MVYTDLSVSCDNERKKTNEESTSIDLRECLYSLYIYIYKVKGHVDFSKRQLVVTMF